MNGMKYVLPAEWHFQRCVQIAWPDESTDWKPYLSEITCTMADIAEAITRHEDLVVVARNASATESFLKERMPSVQMKRILIAECELNDTWARDYGGITLLPADPDENPGGCCEKGATHAVPEQVVLDFHFNGWGGKLPAAEDDKITRRLHEKGIITGRLADNSDFVLEGGSIESDGRGTIFTTSQCLMAPGRNRLTQAEIEEQLKCRLHAKRIVWLGHGRLAGDDTDGHIDTIVRVCPNDTLLYVKSHDAADSLHEDLEALEKELQTLRTDSGNPYTLIPLPMPGACFYDGERLPATYANFLIINGAVLVPVYRQKDLDEEACGIIGGIFPDREIIPIDAGVIIRQHGSVHCLTMQYPA